MTKPANFPERKRQRQLRALERIKPRTAGKPEKGVATRSNAAEMAALSAATAHSKRHVRTKEDRSAGGRFSRSS